MSVERCLQTFHAVMSNLMHKCSEQPEQSSLHKYWDMRILISPGKKCIINTQQARWIFSSLVPLVEGGGHGRHIAKQITFAFDRIH